MLSFKNTTYNVDPPNCGCGLVTTERMKALLKLNREDFGTRNVFPQEQLLYPNSQFTCSGHVVKWIFGAMFMSTREINPELQIWRPISNTTFQKLYGSIITSSVEVTSGIYEFAVNPPLPVKPGDILGVFQPPLVRSKLLVEFDTAAENPMNFYLPLGATALEPSHTFVDIAVGNWQRGTILPLVTAQICKLHSNAHNRVYGVLHVSSFFLSPGRTAHHNYLKFGDKSSPNYCKHSANSHQDYYKHSANFQSQYYNHSGHTHPAYYNWPANTHPNYYWHPHSSHNTACNLSNSTIHSIHHTYNANCIRGACFTFYQAYCRDH